MSLYLCADVYHNCGALFEAMEGCIAPKAAARVRLKKDLYSARHLALLAAVLLIALCILAAYQPWHSPRDRTRITTGQRAEQPKASIGVLTEGPHTVGNPPSSVSARVAVVPPPPPAKPPDSGTVLSSRTERAPPKGPGASGKMGSPGRVREVRGKTPTPPPLPSRVSAVATVDTPAPVTSVQPAAVTPTVQPAAPHTGLTSPVDAPSEVSGRSVKGQPAAKPELGADLPGASKKQSDQVGDSRTTSRTVPVDFDALMKKARRLQVDGDYENAVEAFKHAYALKPSVGLRGIIHRQLLRLGKEEEARKYE